MKILYAGAATSLNVSGTGVHMKIIDYLSIGLPIVATFKSFEGIPLYSLRGYPLAILDPNKDRLIEKIFQLIRKTKGPLSGKASLPTWDEEAKILINFLSKF